MLMVENSKLANIVSYALNPGAVRGSCRPGGPILVVIGYVVSN